MNKQVTSVFLVSTFLLLCLGCASTTQSEKRKYKIGYEPIISALTHTQHLKLYSLSPVSCTKYFKDGYGKRFAPYPIQAGPLSFDKAAMKTVISIICNPANYDEEARLGCGYPHWDYLLKVKYQNKDTDILIWSDIRIIGMFQENKLLGLGYLGYAFDEFGKSWSELVKGASGSEYQGVVK